MTNTTTHGESQPKDDLIDIRLSDLTAFVWSIRWSLLMGAVIGCLLAGVYIFTMPNQYTSSITVLPELQTKSGVNLASLGSLAGLAGIDVSSMGAGPDAIRPELYPTVLQSAPFALSLFKQTVREKGERVAKPFEVYWQQQPKSWIIDWLPTSESDEVEALGDGSEAIELSRAQEAMANELHQRVSASYDKKSGVLTVSSVMPDPVVAARIANLSLKYLTEYVTGYRTEKVRREVDFLVGQVKAAQNRYQSAQYALSAYRDQHTSLFLNTAKIEEQRIQAEFVLAQDLYNTVSKQAEMAKIKVQEQTPVFKVLEPAQIPLKKSGPKRILTMLSGALAGLIISLVISLLVRSLRQAKANVASPV